MVHSSLMASIKTSVSPTNPKQQAAIPFFGHTEILHMLVSVGSTALAAAVILPRYGGLNYASRCITVYNARVKILNKSVSFTTKCIMATERVTESV